MTKSVREAKILLLRQEKQLIKKRRFLQVIEQFLKEDSQKFALEMLVLLRGIVDSWKDEEGWVQRLGSGFGAIAA